MLGVCKVCTVPEGLLILIVRRTTIDMLLWYLLMSKLKTDSVGFLPSCLKSIMVGVYDLALAAL